MVAFWHRRAQAAGVMRMIACYFALVLGPTWSASAKAVFFTQSELIKNAEVIAIIVLEEPEAAKPTAETEDPFVADAASGKRFSYSQQASARVERVIKGEIPKNFTLYGKESFICAQCELTKGRFLAFLIRDGNLWAGANWQLSLRPIRDVEVEWYASEEQRHPMKYQKLAEVVALIQVVIQKQKREQVGTGLPPPDPSGMAATPDHESKETGVSGKRLIIKTLKTRNRNPVHVAMWTLEKNGIPTGPAISYDSPYSEVLPRIQGICAHLETLSEERLDALDKSLAHHWRAYSPMWLSQDWP